MNNFNFDEMWLDLDNELAKASEVIASEARIEMEMEVDDAISLFHLETTWLERVAVAGNYEICAGNTWVKGSVQHICCQVIVMVGLTAITMIAPQTVSMVRELDVKVQKRTHSENRCWHSVLRQVHDVTVLIDNKIISGNVLSIYKDAFDVETQSGRITVPWNRVTSVTVHL